LLGVAAFPAFAIFGKPAPVPRPAADQLGLALIRPPFPLPSFEIAQYWHEKYQRDPAHRWLRSTSHDLFGKSRR
jgi:DNA-binding transcriptional LysR family regulator